MSSMTSFTVGQVFFSASALLLPLAAHAQDATSWDKARVSLVAQGPGPMAGAITQWENLTARDNLSFGEYARFVTNYPDFPKIDILRRRAESAIERSQPSATDIANFFAKAPPLTNAGRAAHAMALTTLNRRDAFEAGRAAWRGGAMSATTEAFLAGIYGGRFTAEDHAARMDALLWEGDAAAGARQIVRIDGPQRDLFMARLALVQGQRPDQAGLSVPVNALSDPGYVYNLSRYHRMKGATPEAIAVLGTRPPSTRKAAAQELMVAELLRVARAAGADSAARIAARTEDLFGSADKLSESSFRFRDDFTSLTWLGGTKALWDLGDGRRAAPMFYNYGAAAQTPQTRSKGFFWAGRALSRAGDRKGAERYYLMAAQYPERFYGQMALKELGRPQPMLGAQSIALPSPDQQALFDNTTLVRAVREVARDAPWRTGVQFYKELADDAQTAEQHAMVASLARAIGRRDLAVILSEAAGANGLGQFVAQGYPTVVTPAGTDWTMVHAISRQESQFADNAISHAGARGLMQLMPGTAREQAGKMGISYMSADLIGSSDTNIRLGDGYFARMMSYFGGSYPLAIAAYNAGPGNVNKWLRANGDPRTGAVGWLDWIERIPLYETRNYVHRVIENAAVYEQLYPAKAQSGRSRTAADFLR